MSEDEQNGSKYSAPMWPTDLFTFPEEFIVCFWANIAPPDEFSFRGCHEWRGQYDRHGRPVMRLDGPSLDPVAIALADVGMPLQKDGYTLVRCENNRCVTPDHFYWARNDE